MVRLTLIFHFTILSEQIEGTEIEVQSRFWDQPVVFRTQLSGTYNAINALAAIVVSHYFGISISDMQKGLADYQATNNRSQLLKKGKHAIWLDAYNANPSSMKAAIQYAFNQRTKPVALILGDMYELGVDSETLHADLGEFINSYQPAMTIGVGERMKAMVQEISSETAWFSDAVSASGHISDLVAGLSLYFNQRLTRDGIRNSWSKN